MMLECQTVVFWRLSMTKAAELAKMGEVITNDQIGGRRNIVINGAMQVAQRSNLSRQMFWILKV